VTDYIRRIRARVGSGELLQLPSASVAVRDREGRVLVARHREGGKWLLPGGLIEPGETPADAAVREAWEETGLVVRLTRLVGVFGGSDHIVEYRNGDRASYVSSVFEGTIEGGELALDGEELLAARFVTEAEAASLPLASWMPEVMRAVFAGKAAGAFRAPLWSPSSRSSERRS
jgi:8-oxo-dGTP pyrophosphatase MutT (NUDIX family)